MVQVGRKTYLWMRLDNGHTSCPVRFLGVSPKEVLLESIVLVVSGASCL